MVFQSSSSSPLIQVATKMASVPLTCMQFFVAEGSRSLIRSRVSSITYGKEIPIATFSAKQVAWKNAYDTMTVGFGSSQGRYKPDSIRIHNDLRKRQLIPTGTISYPSVPSPSTTASSVTHNIIYQADPGAVIFTISHE